MKAENLYKKIISKKFKKCKKALNNYANFVKREINQYSKQILIILILKIEP